jgi:hypothetical protein
MTEAVRAAAPAALYGELTRVFTAEYVCAAALDLYRMKDQLRVASFLEAGKVDITKLEALAARYGLTACCCLIRVSWSSLSRSWTGINPAPRTPLSALIGASLGPSA